MVLRHPWWNYSKEMLRKAWQKRSILVLALRSLFSQILYKSRWNSGGFYQPVIHFFCLLLLLFFTWVTTVQLRTAVRLSGQTEMISWESGRAGNGALLPFKGWSLNQEALPPQQNNRWGIRFLCYVSLRKIAKKAALSAKKPFLTTNRGVSVKAWRCCRRKCSNWYVIDGVLQYLALGDWAAVLWGSSQHWRKRWSSVIVTSDLGNWNSMTWHHERKVSPSAIRNRARTRWKTSYFLETALFPDFYHRCKFR